MSSGQRHQPAVIVMRAEVTERRSDRPSHFYLPEAISSERVVLLYFVHLTVRAWAAADQGVAEAMRIPTSDPWFCSATEPRAVMPRI
jgi:hypothetical protein